MLFRAVLALCILVGFGGTAVQILMHMLERDYEVDEYVRWRR